MTFLDGTMILGTATLASGQATLLTSALPVGDQGITVAYAGDPDFMGSTSGVVIQTINPASSTTALSSTSGSTVYGQPATFTVSVLALAPGAGTPTGSVTFFQGPMNLGTATLAGGSATFSTAALPVGRCSITATYNGDTNFNGSAAGAVTQTVSQDGSTASVSTSFSPSVVGQAVTFTVIVSAAAPGSGTPTGTATLLDGSTVLGVGTLQGGQATLATSNLSVGDHGISIIYPGDANFSGSTSATLTQTVNLDTLAFGGYLLTNVAVSPDGQTISGDADLPKLGTVHLIASTQDLTNLSFTNAYPLPDYQVGPYKDSNGVSVSLTLTNNAVTLASTGLTFTGQAKLGLLGEAEFSGPLDSTNGFYNLQATRLSPSFLAGFVQTDSVVISLTPGTIQADLYADIPFIGRKEYADATLTPDGIYTVQSHLVIDGFDYGGLTITLGDGVSFDARINLPSSISSSPITIANGTISPSEVHFQYLGAIPLGPVVSISDLDFTIGQVPGGHGLDFSGKVNIFSTRLVPSLGKLAFLSDLSVVDAPFHGFISTDHPYSWDVSIGVNVIDIAGYHLANATIAMGNDDFDAANEPPGSGWKVIDNPNHDFMVTVHSDVAGLPFTAGLHLDGAILGDGDYSLTGTATQKIGGLTLSNAQFTLDKDDGLTFSAAGYLAGFTLGTVNGSIYQDSQQANVHWLHVDAERHRDSDRRFGQQHQCGLHRHRGRSRHRHRRHPRGDRTGWCGLLVGVSVHRRSYLRQHLPHRADPHHVHG